MEACRGRTGEITEVSRNSRELCLDWRIPQFLNLEGHNVLQYYESPRFSFCDGCWYLRVFPRYLGGVIFSLCRDDSDTSTRTINFAVGVRGMDGIEERKEVKEQQFRNNSCLDLTHFCTRLMLSEQEERLMPDGALTIRCEMVVLGAAEGIQRAMEDFGRLLESGEKSDVTVQVGEQEFQLHSFVLLARCPALSSSLQDESTERTSNEIVVQDCSPNIFRDLLHFLYTGSVQSITKDNAFALYKIADRYQVEDLKCQCLKYIQNSICIETFCDAVRLALVHREDGLMEQAVAFATSNIPSILRSTEWQNFIREFPDEANKILIRSVIPSCPSCKRHKSKH